MSYVGIHGPQEEVDEFLRHAEERGANIYPDRKTKPEVGVVLEGKASLQIGQIPGALCCIDGRISDLKGAHSKGAHSPHQTSADAIIKKWRRQGEAILREIEITASVSVWDSDSDQLVLVRAQNGIPPLFFAERRNALLWSNSIKSLLSFGVEANLDHRALDAYFTLGYVPSPWTFFAGIRKVPAGQYLDWRGGDWEFKRYQDPVPESRSVGDVEARAAEFKKCLCQSLDRIVEGYDRVGVLLSGGVDSSLLVGLLHCELGAQVEAFTFEYSDYEGEYNEYDQARRLTKLYDIPHHPIDYSGEWLEANLEGAVRKYEEPFTYGHHTAQLREVVESDATLLLNGLWGPAPPHVSRTANYALRIENAFAKRVAGVGKSVLKRGPLRNLSRLRHALDVIESPTSELFYRMPFDRVLPDSIRRRLYADPDRASQGRAAMISLFDEEIQRSGLRRKVDQLSHLHNHFSVSDHFLWWSYRWTNVYDLEMGAPFLMPAPRRYMQSLRQPLWPPYDEPVEKVLIRRVAATLMPDEIAYSEKIAQTAPFWVWFRGPLRSLLREYLQPSQLREDGLFNADFVQQEVKKHVRGSGKRPYLVWSLLCFMIWKHVFLEE